MGEKGTPKTLIWLLILLPVRTELLFVLVLYQNLVCDSATITISFQSSKSPRKKQNKFRYFENLSTYVGTDQIARTSEDDGCQQKTLIEALGHKSD